MTPPVYRTIVADPPWRINPRLGRAGDAPDSRRYAACGDGVTATVSEWIGRRLLAHLSARAEERQ